MAAIWCTHMWMVAMLLLSVGVLARVPGVFVGIVLVVLALGVGLFVLHSAHDDEVDAVLRLLAGDKLLGQTLAACTRISRLAARMLGCAAVEVTLRAVRLAIEARAGSSRP